MRWLCFSSWLVLLGWIGLATCNAQTVILHLRNGDRLSGRILVEDANQVTLDTTALGKIVVPVDQIQRREKLPEPKPAPPTPEEPKPAPAAQPPPKPPVAKAPPEIPKAKPKPAGPKRWNTDIQVGSNLQFNQKELELYYGRLKTTYAHAPLKLIADYRADYGRTDGITSANKMDGSLRGEFDVAPRLFVFNAGGAGYDEIRKIEFSYDDSFGIGYKFFPETNRFLLSMDIGGNYQEQFFTDDTSKDYFALRLGEIANWRINTKFTVNQKFEFFPRLSDLGDYRARFETTLRYLLTTYLNLNLTVIDNYDTQPARGVSNNDLQILSTIGLKF